jgi:hypothetical protein
LKGSLQAHNRLRILHGVNGLIQNSRLNGLAQNQAEYLASNNLYKLSGSTEVGENMSIISSSINITMNDCSSKKINEKKINYRIRKNLI